MLRWSGIETNTPIDLAGIVDQRVEVGVRGGRQLVALARSAASRLPDPAAARAVAGVLGPQAASDAVAGAFEFYNRVVDGTGLPVGRAAREQLADVIGLLGLDRMPHAGR